ncbi:MAG TPA: hypothetical protein ENN36_10430 [Candidatus Bathyarchaeota archaeon]|nr:hypothetical protein [Candidatus Bathyarchaeota archaeon]
MPKTVMDKKREQIPFQLFFLKNDDAQNVEVVELNTINFEEVESRLEKGESIFITRKQRQKPDRTFMAYEAAKEPWYFVRS